MNGTKNSDVNFDLFSKNLNYFLEFKKKFLNADLNR